MPSRIEDYALIGDCQTAALVGRDGSIDWLCLPRFDSGACFAALLGTTEHGRWLLAPAHGGACARRHYRQDTLVLESEYDTPEGTVAIVDCMPPRTQEPEIVRIVIGRRGRVTMRMQLAIRFDYGSTVPWVRRIDGGLRAIAGPDSLVLRTAVPLRGENLTTVAEFTVAEGERVPFVLTWNPSHHPPPAAIDPEEALRFAEHSWREWTAHCEADGPWREAVVRSLITLKALTYAPTGGIVAAATTSLPESLGGVRNWDYRFCWLRDATFTLYAFLVSGYHDEARAWRQWLLRAVAGKPSELQIMYGIGGERRLTELELPWLPGYEGAAPVRIGNAASRQLQWDVYGEILDTMYQCRRAGLEGNEPGWQLERALLDFLESAWDQPDEGIWEVRGPRREFTHSKMMAWVAVDRAVKSVERFKLAGPTDRWRALRTTIHEQVCQGGFDSELNAFVQFYGSKLLDASLLMMPLVGFLPAQDPRVRGTVDAIERHLMRDGFVARYATRESVDGLPPGEGVFLPCTFWMADILALLGRRDDALRIFERLLALRNDVGLLSEQYDVGSQRLIGNFPQAFSHVGLVNTARNLARHDGPAEHRRRS
ncbi:MAG: glycoside hydrolase family 15 protein [Deltaproteobacteria bacterium]|nr:glycoside hydrolase family 15 protein [Deltaproteobacteria bacterium]